MQCRHGFSTGSNGSKDEGLYGTADGDEGLLEWVGRVMTGYSAVLEMEWDRVAGERQWSE